jgi:hypothetical protein
VTRAARDVCVALAALAALAVFAALAVGGCTLDDRVATVTGDAGAPQFLTLAAGTALPDEATCAARVRRSSFEPRPQNGLANAHVATAAEVAQLAPWDSDHAYDDHALALEARVTGDFTGTTDEILQWAACKWGFNEDHVRAEAVESSNWLQGALTDWTTTTADCPPDPATQAFDGGSECAKTYGILQVLWTYHKDAWPMFRDSTAFHVDYVYALRRVCFEGWDSSQAARANADHPYAANDEWGCMGAKFSGYWYDAAANGYIARVQGELAGRVWARPGF